MIDVILSEFIKYKRTFTRKLILLAPLFFILLALPQQLFVPADSLTPWQLLINQAYNWWPVIFLPLGTALFAALMNLQERKAGSYRSICAHNVSPSSIWIGKIIVMAIHSLLAILVLIVTIIISGMIVAGGDIPWSKIFAGGLIIWLTSLTLIPLQLWTATWKGTFASMMLGFLGMITGVVAAPEPYWLYIPWSWPIRLMCPVIGVHPNGVPLKAADSLMNPAVIPTGIAMSIVALIVYTIITSLWFFKREKC